MLSLLHQVLLFLLGKWERKVLDIISRKQSALCVYHRNNNIPMVFTSLRITSYSECIMGRVKPEGRIQNGGGNHNDEVNS